MNTYLRKSTKQLLEYSAAVSRWHSEAAIKQRRVQALVAATVLMFSCRCFAAGNEFTPDSLARLYAQNKSEAKALEGSVVQVHGVIESVQNKKLIFRDGNNKKLTCFLSAGGAVLASEASGSEVTVAGLLRGRGILGNVTLDDCQLVKPQRLPATTNERNSSEHVSKPAHQDSSISESLSPIQDSLIEATTEAPTQRHLTETQPSATVKSPASVVHAPKSAVRVETPSDNTQYYLPLYVRYAIPAVVAFFAWLFVRRRVEFFNISTRLFLAITSSAVSLALFRFDPVVPRLVSGLIFVYCFWLVLKTIVYALSWNEATRRYRKARGGDAEAQYYISKCYSGRDSDLRFHDRAKQLANDWLERSALNGHSVAALEMGNLTEATNPGAALSWYQMAATRSETATKAKWKLARGLEQGTFGAVDLKGAYSWYEQLANAGDAQVKWKLAAGLEKGDFGVVDLKGAYSWYEQLANAGYAQAKWKLAAGLEKGDFGVVDFKGAYSWYEQLANAGDAQALLWLGNACEVGLVAERNTAQAITYYKSAMKLKCAEAYGKYVDLGQKNNEDVRMALRSLRVFEGDDAADKEIEKLYAQGKITSDWMNRYYDDIEKYDDKRERQEEREEDIRRQDEIRNEDRRRQETIRNEDSRRQETIRNEDSRRHDTQVRLLEQQRALTAKQVKASEAIAEELRRQRNRQQ